MFRFQPHTGELTLQPSEEAERVAAALTEADKRAHVKSAVEVRKAAKARILQAGGDATSELLIASESQLQFGKYRGQTFRWLLSNAVGYACIILASHQKEREGDSSQTPLMVHKDLLLHYARQFTKMVAAIRARGVQEGFIPQRANDEELVTLQGYRGKGITFAVMYESTDKELKG